MWLLSIKDWKANLIIVIAVKDHHIDKVNVDESFYPKRKPREYRKERDL